MGGHGVGDCGLVSEDRVIALDIGQTKRGRLRRGAALPYWLALQGVSEAYAATHRVSVSPQWEVRSCSFSMISNT